MASATAAVARVVEDAFVLADMPFLSFGADEAVAIENCGRMVKEAGADGVKLECGPHTVDLTRRLTQLGIPVQAHLGLTPSTRTRPASSGKGRTGETAKEILDLARKHGTRARSRSSSNTSRLTSAPR